MANVTLFSICYGVIFFMIHILHVNYGVCSSCFYLLDVKLILALSFIANIVIPLFLIKSSGDSGEPVNKKGYFKILSFSIFMSLIGIVGLVLIVNGIGFDNLSKISAIETFANTFGVFLLCWGILNPLFLLHALVAKIYYQK